MTAKLKETMPLLIQDGKKLENINFQILLSWNRNQFFYHLGNYIAFYNQAVHAIKKHPSYKDKELPLRELHFEDYSLSPVVQFLFLIFLPLSFIVLLFQWSYLSEIKRDIRIGVLAFEKLMQEEWK